MPLLVELLGLLDAKSVTLFLVTVVVFAIPVLIIFPPVPVEICDALSQTHTKIGVPRHESKLRDQYASPQPRPQQQQASPKVHSLHVYPLKSCRGIELDEATVLPMGLQHDRVFCLAQRKKQPRTGALQWQVLTLRQAARMANVEVELWVPDPTKHSRQLGPVRDDPDDDGENGNDVDGNDNSHGPQYLVVRFPWRHPGFFRGMMETVSAKLSRGLLAGRPQREFLLPLRFPSAAERQRRGYESREVHFFHEVFNALDMSPELPPELALYLDLPPENLALLRMDPSCRRDVLRCAPGSDEAGYQPKIDLQDCYPLHILNLNSVRALESKIRRDENIDRLDARRFRPNIIVSGLPEYDEDDWQAVQFKAVSNKDEDSLYHVSSRTVRCKLPNVDPATGIRHKVEPDYALRHYRDIDTGAPKNGCMGMSMCPLFSSSPLAAITMPSLPSSSSPSSSSSNLRSTIRVGMEIAVLKRGSHHAL